MGLPWDDTNLVLNLAVLASMQNGDKLSVLKSGANPTDLRFRNLGKGGRGLRDVFDVQQGGFLNKAKVAIERAKKGENITNDLQYMIPLTNIFKAALRQWHERTINQRIVITNAFQGLQRMRQTYSGGGTAGTKMQAIITAAQPLVPQQAARRYIILRGNTSLDLTTTDTFANLRNTFGGFIDATPDSLKEEIREDTSHGMTLETREEMMRGIFGSADPSQAQPTTIPSMPQTPFVRQGTCVCPSYWKDHYRGGAFYLNGNKMGTGGETFAAMGDMFEALGQDEAMLFLVSQLASQGGINGMMSQLLTHHTAANWRGGTFDFVLGCGNNRVCPSIFTGHTVGITTSGGSVTVDVFSPVDLTSTVGFMVCDLHKASTFTNISQTSGTILGFNQFNTALAVRCRRVDNAITWELTTAKIDYAVT